MTANQHATATIVNSTLVTTAETIIAQMNPYSINQGVTGGGGGDLRLLQPATPPGAQGTILDYAVAMTVGTAGTSVTFRVRPNTIGTAAVHTSPAFVVVAGPFNISWIGLDTTLSYPVGVTYLLTAQVGAATGNSTINSVVFTTEDANSFE